jgi:hypothetical protein
MNNQILRIQVPQSTAFSSTFDRAFLKYTSSSELISIDSVAGGALNELTYSIGMKKSSQIQEFLDEIKSLNAGNKLMLLAGYNGSDL